MPESLKRSFSYVGDGSPIPTVMTDNIDSFERTKKLERSLYSESSISDTRSTDSNETSHQGQQLPLKRQSSEGSTKFGSEKSVMRTSLSFMNDVNGATSYRGMTFEIACRSGNLPLVVLLWSMATAKGSNLMVFDSSGNNPMHYAAVADTSEIMAFLYQQCKGRFTNDIRLVDTRNDGDETPFLYAMEKGNILVIRALLDEGSDIFAVDKYGHTAFMILAKGKHIWAVHYLYLYICDRFGIGKAVNFINSKDRDGHNVLDRAAYVGDVNLLEYFIRKGLDPSNHVDHELRSPLHWAVTNNHVEATRFLVLLGCNPSFSDTSNLSPKSIATSRLMSHPKLFEAINATFGLYREHGLICSFISSIHECSRFSEKKDNTELCEKIVLNGGVNCYIVMNDKIRSLSIVRTNTFSLTKTFLFTSVVFGLWMCTIIMPFFYWFSMILLVILIYNFVIKKFVHKTPEKFVGFYLGLYSAMLFFWFCNVYIRISTSIYNTNADRNVIIFHKVANAHKYAYLNSYQMGALSGSTHDESLLWLFGACLVVSLCLLSTFVVFKRDEGMIDTRIVDFDNILHHGILCNGQPPTRLFCTKTFVQKPLRSKYCKKTGYTIARYDHFCKWLHTAIGYYNHRRFLLFITIHLLTTISGAAFVLRAMIDEITFGHKMTTDDSCTLISTIVSGRYFSPFVLLVLFLVSSFYFCAILIEQVINVCTNTTTNERINHSRYPWMRNDDGVVSNRFDRGIFINICEFFRIFGHSIDYTVQFEMPQSNNYIRADESVSKEGNLGRTGHSVDIEM